MHNSQMPSTKVYNIRTLGNRLIGPDGAVAMSRAGRYWVRISLPAPTQSGFIKAQWVGVRPLYPILCH